MKVRQCMKQEAISIAEDANVQAAAYLFVRHHIGTLPVVNRDKKLVGILHLSDLLHLVMPAFVDLIPDFDFVRADFGIFEDMTVSEETADMPIRDLMGAAISVQADSGLLRAFAFLDSYKQYDLPVVDADGRFVGLASRVDVGTALLAHWQIDQSTSQPP